MATRKRTQKEIEKDCKRIKEAAKTATSIRDIERATNLSYSEINTTMSKHPTIFKRIKNQLEANKEQSKIEKNNKTSADTEKKVTLKVQKEEHKSINKTKKNSQLIKTNCTVTNKTVKNYVIDASITGIKSLRDVLSKICTSESKIILTSITIKELEKMQKFRDLDGIDAGYILALAAENYTSFETVLIDESFETPDDCIINYCAENNKDVILLTSDKTMALKARMYNVQVHYLKQNQANNSDFIAKQCNSKIRTLFPAKRIGNKLLISGFHTNTISICVYSNGMEYSDGVKELKIGDDVFVASKKTDYITFAHYKIISLYAENNCKLIYSKRFYDYNNIDVPKTSYDLFIKDFKKRHNL